MLLVIFLTRVETNAYGQGNKRMNVLEKISSRLLSIEQIIRDVCMMGARRAVAITVGATVEDRREMPATANHRPRLTAAKL